MLKIFSSSHKNINLLYYKTGCTSGDAFSDHWNYEEAFRLNNEIYKPWYVEKSP